MRAKPSLSKAQQRLRQIHQRQECPSWTVESGEAEPGGQLPMQEKSKQAENACTAKRLMPNEDKTESPSNAGITKSATIGITVTKFKITIAAQKLMLPATKT